MVAATAPDRIHAQMIETQYQQARNNILSENTVLLFMAAGAALHTDWRIVASWVGCEVATQIYRSIFMLRPYAAGLPARNFAAYWARHHAIYQTAIGLLWGATMFLFAHPNDPLSVVLTVCGLVVIASGAVPGLAYNPLALRGFLATIFTLMFIRLMLLGTPDHIILAIAAVMYAGVLWLMGALQTRTVADGIRIRFENIELLDELTVRTSEAVAARATAEAANLAKSQFLAAASHDLRQPLYALGLFSGSLQALDLDREAADIVTQMQGNLGALEGLFNGLLDISRLEAGVIGVKREAVTADVLFDHLDHYLRPTASSLGIDLRYRSDGSVMFSDPALVEQILINLGSNALRNTERGGVLIAARRRGDMVRLEVWDTGIGIAAADLDRIFDEFVQVGNPERNRRKGMGLGLAIVRRAANLLGTGIAVHSRVGRGTVFFLSQPVATGGASVRAVEPSISTDPIAGLRLLLIEDDPDVRSAIGVLLSQWGIDADIVADAETALMRVAAGENYRIAISDYRLPGTMTGLELVQRIARDSGGDIACCVVTGDLDPAILATAAAAGIPLAHKPLSPARLRALISHLAAG